MNTPDLHICGDSFNDSRAVAPCDCRPEYYCYDLYGEDKTISTIISWQHFPRSTSTRSFCDEISDEIRPTLSTTESSEERIATEETKESSTEYPIKHSRSQLKALHYLEIRHIFELLNFLISQLVINEPEDPVRFLSDFLEKCLRYRESIGDPPFLFTSSHIEALFNAFDPFERGYITIQQYHEAMMSLGLANNITPYEKEPTLADKGCVKKEYFMREVERCLIGNLKSMLAIPKPWEENRLVWKSRMTKMNSKRRNLMSKRDEDISYDSEEDKGKKYCTCSGVSNAKLICRCSSPSVSLTNLENEPEQLFFKSDFPCG